MKKHYHRWEKTREFIKGTNPSVCIKCGVKRRRRAQTSIYEYKWKDHAMWRVDRPDCEVPSVDKEKLTPIELFVIYGKPGDKFITRDHKGSIKTMLNMYGRRATIDEYQVYKVKKMETRESKEDFERIYSITLTK